MKILNAFTPAMMSMAEGHGRVEFAVLADDAEAAAIAQRQGVESCVGHQGAADLYSAKLGVPVSMNRISVQLARGETALLGQYTGPRLPEGRVLTAEELAGAGVRWMLVTVA
jgi:hypothetical protein